MHANHHEQSEPSPRVTQTSSPSNSIVRDAIHSTRDHNNMTSLHLFILFIFLGAASAAQDTASNGDDECSPVLQTIPNVDYIRGSITFDSPDIMMLFSRVSPAPPGASLEAIVYDGVSCFAGNVIALTSGSILPSGKSAPSSPAFDLSISDESSPIVLNLEADFTNPFFKKDDCCITICVTFQSLVCGMLIDFVDVAVDKKKVDLGWYDESSNALDADQQPNNELAPDTENGNDASLSIGSSVLAKLNSLATAATIVTSLAAARLYLY